MSLYPQPLSWLLSSSHPEIWSQLEQVPLDIPALSQEILSCQQDPNTVGCANPVWCDTNPAWWEVPIQSGGMCKPDVMGRANSIEWDTNTVWWDINPKWWEAATQCDGTCQCNRVRHPNPTCWDTNPTW